MKVIIAPDKFKGSLTSFEVCKAIREGLIEKDASIQTIIFPVADGGDGFAEVMKYYLGTTTIQRDAVDPLGRKIVSSYEWNESEKVAIIELANCSGLAMLKQEERNPMITSTYGTGLQIKHAIDNGAKKIILGLGGSATNDAGMGILSALGFVFLDEKENELTPCGKNLASVHTIIPAQSLPAITIEIACDVNNPMYGPLGAAYVFSLQKGASPEQVHLLDEGLKNFAEVLLSQTGKDVATVPGSGAAGGIAAGLMAFMNVEMRQGMGMIIEASGIKNAINDADLIITGEGKIDDQTFHGKTVHAIATMAREKNIPVAAICGKLELTEAEWRKEGLVAVIPICDATMTEEESMRRAGELVREKAASILKYL